MKHCKNSINGELFVIINKNLSKEGAAENYSHEAIGHAIIYVLSNGNYQLSVHQTERLTEKHFILKKAIIRTKKETIKNMKQK